MTEKSERQPRGGTGEDHPARAIEDEHRVLRTQLEVLKNAGDRLGVLSVLQDLPKRLAEHFADEEAARGLYEDLARRCPPIYDDIEALRAEHRAILEEFEALTREVQSLPGTDEAISETTMGGVARCVERLRRHEHLESKMIADVYYTDEGGHG